MAKEKSKKTIVKNNSFKSPSKNKKQKFKLTKKELVKLLIPAFLLLVMIFGATYAYFAVTTVNNFGTSLINAQAGSIGSVTLNGSNANLTMNLTALDMVQGNSDIVYYASTSGKTTTPTTATLGTASVSPTSDPNTYHCTYTLSVTHTGTRDMFTAFNHQTNDNYDYDNRSERQIILRINDTNYDFYLGWPINNRVNGDFYISGNQTVNITASLRFKNDSDIDQTYLAGTDIQISINLVAGSLSCVVEEEPNWVYYGWDEYGNGCDSESEEESCYDTYPTFDAARGGYITALRSNTGNALYSGIDLLYEDDNSISVQICGLIDGSMVCADYLDPSRSVGIQEIEDEEGFYNAIDDEQHICEMVYGDLTSCYGAEFEDGFCEGGFGNAYCG